jgi:hypothetical protein
VLEKDQKQSILIKKFCDRINDVPYDNFRTSISWHPSGKYILVSKPERFIRVGKVSLRHVSKSVNKTKSYIMFAVWIVDIKSKTAKLIFYPGYVNKGINDQIESAGRSIHNAMFISNGRRILYAVDNDLHSVDISTDKPLKNERLSSKVIASFGCGIVYSNKTWEVSACTGILDMAWSEKHRRLYVYTERFFGSGLSEFKYITSKGRKWSKPHDYYDMRDEILDVSPNIQSCSIDEKGDLWVRYFNNHKNYWLWSSTKSSASLPPNADNPAFTY